MKTTRFFFALIATAVPLFACPPAFSHPMDLGLMRVEVLDDRLKVGLRLHVLAVERMTGAPAKSVTNEALLSELAPKLFSATLGQSTPVLGGDSCHWRAPILHVSADSQFLDLSSIAVCLRARSTPFSLIFPVPFVQNQPPAFQLVAEIHKSGETSTLVATAKKPQIELGATYLRGFWGFIRLGMGHIGALPEEWIGSDGSYHIAEGIDHILFVLALVVGGGSLWGLIKCVSGFTLGHSLTLALSTLKIIHIHSRWIEAFIALSIAYVAGDALFRREAPHRWRIAALFGTVHGLGFASTLQELDLPRHELIKALLGFNIGVELGQCAVICVALIPIALLRKAPSPVFKWAHVAMSLSLMLIGSYWFLLRAVN